MHQRVTDRIRQNPATWRSPPLADRTRPWAIVLAGNDGVRLRPLVEYVHGDSRPTPYAAFLGSRSLLQQALDRVAVRIDPARTVMIANARHAPDVPRDRTRHPARAVLLQPADCGRRPRSCSPPRGLRTEIPTRSSR